MTQAFIFIFTILISGSMSYADATQSEGKIVQKSETDINVVINKFNLPLQRLIIESKTAGVNLADVRVLGILRTNQRIESQAELIALFQDPKTQIRAVIPTENGCIVTFSASLAGVLNAGSQSVVTAIQMSQRL